MADLRQQCLDAFYIGQEDVTWKLLPKVHQPQTVKDDRNRTLLHFAAWHDWHNLCQILIENYHLNPTEKTKRGATPLHWACLNGSAQVVKYLLTLPALLLTVNDEDVFGWSAFDRACGCGHLPVVEILLTEPSLNLATKHLPVDKFSVLSLLSSRIEWTTQFTLYPYFRVFIAGNSAAGKTTLATAIVNLDHYSSQHGGWVSEVKTLTAGICPTQCSG